MTCRELQCALQNRKEELSLGNSHWRGVWVKALRVCSLFGVVKLRDYSGSKDSGRSERKRATPPPPSPTQAFVSRTELQAH